MKRPTSSSLLADRRKFMTTSLGIGGLFFTKPGLFAQELVQTPTMTIGPFYPDRMPLDLDNDLLRLNDNLTPAIGQISWLSGRVLGRNGLPLRNALVEIWQTDNNGAYIHSQSPIANRDANFQGYGHFVTGRTGEYLFRTVKPGLYPGRTRHVHAQITAASGEKLVTQLFIEGESLNNSDGVLNGVRDSAQRASVLRPWTAIADSPIGELAVTWDIVFGLTPADSTTATRPTIMAQNGVVNGAGFQTGITPGAWVTIFGDDLSKTTRTWNPQTEILDGKLPTSLDGVSVTINGMPAAIYYVSPGQLNVQAPSDASTGPVEVVVTNSDGKSDPVMAPIQTFLPGFFLFDRYFVTAASAKPGETISLFGTGFGPTSPSVNAGEVYQGAAPLTNAVEIRIGSTYASVQFAGLSSAGLYQFNLTVPNVADGDHDVRATIAGVRTQPLAKLRVRR